MTGRIIRVNRDRGFASVLCPDGATAFLHASDVLGVPFDDLAPGDRLAFEVVDDPKGPRAINAHYPHHSEVLASN